MDSTDVLFPKSLTLPIVSPANSQKTPKKGTICISGAKLYFYNGTAWEIVTSA